MPACSERYSMCFAGYTVVPTTRSVCASQQESGLYFILMFYQTKMLFTVNCSAEELQSQFIPQFTNAQYQQMIETYISVKYLNVLYLRCKETQGRVKIFTYLMQTKLVPSVFVEILDN